MLKREEKECPLYFLFTRKEKLARSTKDVEDSELLNSLPPYEEFSRVFLTEKLNINEINRVLAEENVRPFSNQCLISNFQQKQKKELNEVSVICILYEVLSQILVKLTDCITNHIIESVVSSLNASLKFSEYQNVIAFLFTEYFLRLSEDPLREFDDKIISLFFNQVSENPKLTGKSFPALVQFVKHSKANLYGLIRVTIESNYPISQGAEFEKLIPILKEGIIQMNLEALSLLWYISPRVETFSLTGVFNDIIKLLFNSVIEKANIKDFLIKKDEKNIDFPSLLPETRNEMSFHNLGSSPFDEIQNPIPQTVYPCDIDFIKEIFDHSFLIRLDNLSKMISDAVAAKIDIGNKFFGLFCEAMNKKRGKVDQFYSIYCILIYILNKIDNKKLNDFVVSNVELSVIFNENETIFNSTNTFFVGYIRNYTLQAVALSMSNILTNYKESPLIFTEIITRFYIMSSNDYFKFTKGNTIFYILSMICRMEKFKEYEQCRNILLTILYDILFDTESFDNIVKKPVMLQSFLISDIMIELLFDMSVSNFTASSICRMVCDCSEYSSKVMVNILMSVLILCKENSSDENYFRLGCALLKQLSETTKYNINFSKIFANSKGKESENFVCSLSFFVLKANDRELFDSYMELCLNTSIANPEFTFDSSSFKIIVDASKGFKLRLDEADIFLRLINSSTFTPKALNEIVFNRPQHLLFLFTVFGETEDVTTILKMINSSIDTTYSNIFALRKGNIYPIICSYICQDNNEVIIREYGYKVIFNDNDLQLIFEVFSKLFSRDPTIYEISSLVNYIKDSHTEKAMFVRKNFLNKILIKNEEIPGPHFIINNFTNRKITIPAECLEEFTFEFWLKLDSKKIKKYNEPFQLFKIIDKEGKYLAVIINNPNMEMVFQDIDHRISVPLILHVTYNSNWHHYTISFDSKKDSILNSIKDNEQPKKSDFIVPTFVGDNLLIEIGGAYKESMIKDFLGIIGEIRVFDKSLNLEESKELVSHNEWNIPEAKFSSKSFMQKAGSSIPNILALNGVKPILVSTLFLMNEEEQKDIMALYEFISWHSTHTTKDIEDAFIIQNIFLEKINLTRTYFDSFLSILFSTKGQIDEMSWVTFIIDPFIWLAKDKDEDLKKHYLRNLAGSIADFCCEVFPRRSNVLGLFCNEMALLFDKESDMDVYDDEYAFRYMSLFLLKISTVKSSYEDIKSLLLCIQLTKRDKLKNVYIDALLNVSKCFEFNTFIDFDPYLYPILIRSTTEIAAKMILISSEILNHTLSTKSLSISCIAQTRGDSDAICDKIVNCETATTDILSIAACIQWNRDHLRSSALNNINSIKITKGSDLYLFPLLYSIKCKNQKEQIYIFTQIVVPALIKAGEYQTINKVIVLLEALVDTEIVHKVYKLIVGLFITNHSENTDVLMNTFFLLATSIFVKLVDDDSCILSSSNVFELLQKEKKEEMCIVPKDLEIKCSSFTKAKGETTADLTVLKDYLSNTPPKYRYEVSSLISIIDDILLVTSDLKLDDDVQSLLLSISNKTRKFDEEENISPEKVKQVTLENSKLNENFERIDSIIGKRIVIVKEVRKFIAKDIKQMFDNESKMENIINNNSQTVNKEYLENIHKKILEKKGLINPNEKKKTLM